MLKNNKLNLLISIVCAIVLWAYITTVVNPATERTISGIPVELVNVDALNDRGFTVAEGMTFLVDVVVTGARSETLKLSPSDFRATADVTGYRKGSAAIPVNVTLPNNMELVQVRPETIQVEIVDLITVFKQVRLEYEEEFPGGLEPGFIKIIPEEMEVSGVAEDVDRVDYIRALVGTGDLTEEMNTFRVDVHAIDKEGEIIHKVGLSQNSVEVTGMLCTTKRVPVEIETIGEANESIEVTDMFIPRFVTVRGAAADIEAFTEAECRPVDLSSITETVEFMMEDILRLPDGIELAKSSKNLSLRIEVQGIARKEFRFTADMIEVRNLGPSLSGHVNTGSVTVTVLATRDVLAGITQDDLDLYVDATGLIRVGSAMEMEVFADCKTEVKKILFEPQRVRVTVIRE